MTTLDHSPDGAADLDGGPELLSRIETDGASRSPTLELANAMVRIYKEAFGRGPTKARAQFAGPDTLVVVLEKSLTVAERNLVSLGDEDRLCETRLRFRRVLEQQLREVVEEILGRPTRACISGIDPSHDVAVEVFILEPRSDQPLSA